MRALTLALLVAFVVASQAYTESNELNKSPREIVAESDLMSDQYDVVVFIGDSYENLPASLSSIADAISAYVKINPGAGSAMSVIPYSVHPSRKLIWASTGDLSSDIASSRKLRQTGENAMRRVHNLGFQRVLLVIGPLMTAHHSFDWAFGDYPKMSAALGGLHYLFKPLQVREMVGPEAKVDKLGLYDFSPKLLKFVEAVGEGMGVLRDIGDSDPERTAPPKIVEYIEARRPDWEAAGISLTVEDVIQMKDKYPMAYAVNRATIPNPNHHGKVVTAVYTPKSNTPITETIILVGKGVALDTGGADLKTEGGMYGMHNDKLGAAFVAGFFHTLSLLKPEGVKVIGYMPYIRNSIGKYAYLPDEIITLVNGLRVRIGDTDAEGRNIMSDVLYYAKEQAKKETNPHIFTIATLTGAASRSFGPYTVVMDNGPAEDVKMAQKMMACGDRIGDPAEVSRIRYEDFTPNMGNSEFIDIHQYNPYGGTSKRGHSFAMGFLSMASQIDKHGRNSGIPIPYTHCDIAGSGGGINELATAAPLRMFSLRFLWSRTKE